MLRLVSTPFRESRYAAVTPLPIVVASANIDLGDPDALNRWMYEILEGFGEYDFIPLPPDAYAAVIALDRSAIRKLGREFDVKLSHAQVADIFHFAKLIDAVRLASDREGMQLCLLALEKAKGKKQRDFMQEAFERKGLFDAEDICYNYFTGLCASAHLGLVSPKEGSVPQVAIVAPNLVEGLKIQIMLSLHQSRAAAHCDRCGNAYIRHTQQQRFCGERCASRERQARYRANNVKGHSR